MATGKTRAALFYVIIIFLVGAAASLLSMPVYAQTPVTPPANASINEVTVRPASLNGWRFTLEAPVASGEFVSGPAQAPLGSGSLQLSTSGQGAYALSTPAYAGLRLNALSHLAYATYRSSFDPDEHTTVNLQFDIDYNVEDENPAPQGRLVFEPYMTNRPVGGVEQNIWQAWDALATNSAWWATAQPGARYCTQPSPCTWQQILALFPRAAIAAEKVGRCGCTLAVHGSGRCRQRRRAGDRRRWRTDALRLRAGNALYRNLLRRWRAGQ
jgi:hypothetical protein